MVAFRNTGVALWLLEPLLESCSRHGDNKHGRGLCRTVQNQKGSGHAGNEEVGVKGGEPNGVELSSHSSDGTRLAALALARACASAHVCVGSGEISPV